MIWVREVGQGWHIAEILEEMTLKNFGMQLYGVLGGSPDLVVMAGDSSSRSSGFESQSQNRINIFSQIIL